MFKNLHITR